jgi:CRISPR type III-A-associated protein Csm2
VDAWADGLGQQFGFDRLAKTQLRAFFNQAKRLQTMLRAARAGTEEDAFRDIAVKLIDMKAKAHLRRWRNNGIPESFRYFIELNVEKAAKSPRDFEAFVRHFEAVVCYCEGRLGKE